MDEEPEGVGFREAHDQQIAYDEVDALRVAHFGEMVGDTLEDGREWLFLEFDARECTLYIFFYLRECFMFY